METDILLDHVPTRRRIVIDTKFTSIVTKGRYREEVLKSGYIYQIYAYIFSQKGRGDPHADSAAGLLLHPAVHAHVDELAIVQDHAIRFGTVDLAAHPREIKAQLLRFADPEGYVIAGPRGAST
ncbi:5-methylcytosine-specific restriction enzyme subunit McrC [compost metagenome]